MKTRIYPLLAAVVLGALAGCGSPPDNRTEPTSEVRSAQLLPPTCGPGFRQACCGINGCLCCIPVHPDIQTLTPSPWYQVVNIDYTPIGNMSQFAYSRGSYTGSHVDTQTITSIGIDAHFSAGEIFDAENKFLFGTVSGTGQGLQITDTTGTQISANMVDDIAHHEKDLFSIWVNIVVDIASLPPSNRIQSITIRPSGTPVIETVTAAELLGSEPIPSWKRLSILTDADKQRILAMDPFFAPGGFNPASTRFEPKKSLDLVGPSDPGGNFVAHTYDLQSDMSSDSTGGWQVSDEITADYGFIPKVFSAGIDLQYQYQKLTTTTAGTTTDASLNLGTSNVGVHVGVEVYKDKAFNTFIVVPKPTDSTGAPSAWDACGSPHSLCEPGLALDATCQANSCLQTVCAGDPYCCEGAWDSTCVSEVSWCAPAVCGSAN
jgi:hypothetical protein